MAQSNLARPPVEAEIATAQAAEIKRLRGWLTELSNVKGDNSLAESLARRIRFLARKALQGEKV